MAGGSFSLINAEEEDEVAFLALLAVVLVATALAAGTSSPPFTTALSPLLLLLLSCTAVIIFLNTLGIVLSRPINSLWASAAVRPRWRTIGAKSDKHCAEASRT